MSLPVLIRQVLCRRWDRWRPKLWFALLVAVVLGVPAAGFAIGPRVTRCFCESKQDIARLEVKKLRYEAYDEWSHVTGRGSCPTEIRELFTYMDHKNNADPWGTPYIMVCSNQLPDDAHGMAFASAGPDREYFTGDDIVSYR